MNRNIGDGLDTLLCCPHCKSELARADDLVRCGDCGTLFPEVSIRMYEGVTRSPDFRLGWRELFDHSYAKWRESQRAYERKDPRKRSQRNYEQHLERIARERPIYEQFALSGRVLDVGGHRGRIREYLDDVDLYVSLDPFRDVFVNIENEPDYVRAYPCVKDPLNFILGNAENLPLKSNAFDWVHMRSSVDHFENPLVAFKEAYRVLQPLGKLFVAVSLRDQASPTKQLADVRRRHTLRHVRRVWATDGIRGIAKVAVTRLPRATEDHHTWLPDYVALEKTLNDAGFEIESISWAEKRGQWVNLAAVPLAKKSAVAGSSFTQIVRSGSYVRE